MKRLTITLALAVFLLAGIACSRAVDDATGASPDLSAYKFGLCVHFNTRTFGPGHLPPEQFAPTGMDMAGWARAAKDNGMTFALLTAKHDTGFCLWPSDASDYNISQSPVKRDLVTDFASACKAFGIVPGVLYSIPDEHNDGPVKWSGPESKAYLAGPVGQAYFNVIKQHLVELQTRHPDLGVFVLDCSGRLSADQTIQILKLLRKNNPACIVLGGDNYRGGLDGKVAYGTIVKTWFWEPSAQLATAEALVAKYSNQKDKSQSYLLNVSPDRGGRIPENQMEVLGQFAKLKANAGATPEQGAQPAKPSAADRLKQLKSLYEQGLINKEDYDKKVKEIMDSL